MDSLKVCHYWRVILISLIFSEMCTAVDLTGLVKALTNQSDVGKLDKAIIGGRSDTIIRNPWLAFVNLGRGTCGGSIIERRWILTAAHCLYGTTDPSTVTVTIGVDNIGKGGNSILAEKIFIYKDFDRFTLNHDLGLIYLKSALNYTQYIRNINLANTMPADGSICRVSGFGVTQEGGSIQDQLRSVDVPILSDKVCSETYSDYFMNGLQFCAGTDGKDSCQGDSGGPLVCDDMLTGIVSWGRGCGREGFPGVYVKVCNPKYLEWIHSIMQSLP